MSFFDISLTDIKIILEHISKEYNLVKKEDADTKELFLNLDEYVERLCDLLKKRHALDLPVHECHSLLIDVLTPPIETKLYDQESTYIELTSHILEKRRFKWTKDSCV